MNKKQSYQDNLLRNVAPLRAGFDKTTVALERQGVRKGQKGLFSEQAPKPALRTHLSLNTSAEGLGFRRHTELYLKKLLPWSDVSMM